MSLHHVFCNFWLQPNFAWWYIITIKSLERFQLLSLEPESLWGFKFLIKKKDCPVSWWHHLNCWKWLQKMVQWNCGLFCLKAFFLIFCVLWSGVEGHYDDPVSCENIALLPSFHLVGKLLHAAERWHWQAEHQWRSIELLRTILTSL